MTDQERAEQRQALARERWRLYEKTITLGGDDDEPENETEVASTEPTPAVEEESLIATEDVFRKTQVNGPVGFTIVSATKKGNVWMARDFWTFQDVVYLARLFDRMLRPLPLKSVDSHTNVSRARFSGR